jgi:hypothetical protein
MVHKGMNITVLIMKISPLIPLFLTEIPSNFNTA